MSLHADPLEQSGSFVQRCVDQQAINAIIEWCVPNNDAGLARGSVSET